MRKLFSVIMALAICIFCSISYKPNSEKVYSNNIIVNKEHVVIDWKDEYLKRSVEINSQEQSNNSCSTKAKMALSTQLLQVGELYFPISISSGIKYESIATDVKNLQLKLNNYKIIPNSIYNNNKYIDIGSYLCLPTCLYYTFDEVNSNKILYSGHRDKEYFNKVWKKLKRKDTSSSKDWLNSSIQFNNYPPSLTNENIVSYSAINDNNSKNTIQLLDIRKCKNITPYQRTEDFLVYWFLVPKGTNLVAPMNGEIYYKNAPSNTAFYPELNDKECFYPDAGNYLGVDFTITTTDGISNNFRICYLNLRNWACCGYEPDDYADDEKKCPIYYHNGDYFKKGTKVKAGQIIGYAGTSGLNIKTAKQLEDEGLAIVGIACFHIENNKTSSCELGTVYDAGVNGVYHSVT